MNSIHTNKSAGLLRTAMVLICVFCLTVLTVGCDDKGSSASKLEEARIAIDNGQYQRAIDVLDGMTGKEVLEVQASAYAGLAGIDSFEILAEVDDGGSGDGSIDLIGKMLGTGDSDVLTFEEIKAKADDIDRARTTLIDSVGGETNIKALDADGKVKLAIYSFTEVVLMIGKVAAPSPGDSVTLTEAGIEAIQATEGDFVVGDITGVDMGNEIDPIDRLNEDLTYIAAGIDALVGDNESNDLADDFSVFLDEVDCITNDGSVDANELAKYLNDLIL